jgi:ribosomal protein S18 acetylase RimI-like enzyme
MSHTITISIRPYEAVHQPWFEKFNRTWIEKYFGMEPIDFQVLQHPEEHILAKGGLILMAYADQEIAGTVALKYASPGVYEFTKMSVDEKFRGLKIGRALSEAAIEKARSLGAYKVILYSHTSLTTAIQLYRKLGFQEVPVDGPYKRSDIKMELPLENPVTIRQATEADVKDLVEIGIRTFRDTFDEHNTPEDMQAYVDNAFTDEKLTEELRQDKTVFYVAYYKDQIAGYAKVRENEVPPELGDVHALELHRLYVDKEHFGKKVGDRLMDICLHKAAASGYQCVWLGVWENNPRAIKFYTRKGFEKFSDHVFVLGNDAQTDWLMKKSI